MPEISQICQKEIVEERRFIEYNISGSYKILQIILTSWVYYCPTYEIGGESIITLYIGSRMN